MSEPELPRTLKHFLHLPIGVWQKQYSAFTGYYATELQSKAAELIFTKNNLSAADYTSQTIHVQRVTPSRVKYHSISQEKQRETQALSQFG